MESATFQVKLFIVGLIYVLIFIKNGVDSTLWSEWAEWTISIQKNINIETSYDHSEMAEDWKHMNIPNAPSMSFQIVQVSLGKLKEPTAFITCFLFLHPCVKQISSQYDNQLAMVKAS